MKPTRKFWLRSGLGAAGLVLAASIIAPYIRINQYSSDIRSAIERALHRKVQIGEARIALLTGPGLRIENVTIYDVPQAGLEPFAYMASMKVSFSLRSLWTQRLEVSAVELEEPSVNLVKLNDGSGWNIQQLVVQSATGTAPASLPTVAIEGGRINFKFGETKSSFYLSDANVLVRPRSSRPGALLIEFEAAPARTDRSDPGFGRFSGRGQWIAGPDGTRLALDAALEKTYVDELAVLFQGRSLGLHGLVSATAKIYGPIANPKLLGSIELEDLHRWDIIHAHSGTAWRAKFNGSVDLLSGTVEINAGQNLNPASPVSLRLFATHLQNQPEWVAEAAVDGLPAPALLSFVRNLGAPLPIALSIQGNVNGMIGYGSGSGLQGQLKIQDAELAVQNGPTFAVPEADVALMGDELRLLPATLAAATGNAQIEASYAPLRQNLSAKISGRRLRMNLLQNGSSGLFTGAAVPVVHQLRGGTWSGNVGYSSKDGGAPVWDAQLQIHDTAIRVAGLSGPVQIETADLTLAGDNTSFRNVRGSVGAIEFQGRYVQQGGSTADHIDLRFERITLSELEAALLPALSREPGFLARTLSFRRREEVPGWLRTRKVQGSLRATELMVGETELKDVLTNVTWNGSQVELHSMEAKYDGARVRAALAADLSEAEPKYTVGAQVVDLPWRSGLVDLHAAAETAGTGVQLVLNLRTEGSFRIRSSSLSPDHALRTASGAFDLVWVRSAPRLKLIGVQALIDGERFSGEGSTRADGHLELELASPQRVMRLAGSLAPLKLEVTADRIAAR